MKIYDEDGRCISHNVQDIEFGWNVNDIQSQSKRAIVLHEPKIAVYGAKSVAGGLVDEMPSKPRTIVTDVLYKEALVDLIRGESVEAQALLSVIHAKGVPRRDLHNRQDIIDPSCQGSSKNMLSLMAELALVEKGDTKHLTFRQTVEQDSGIDCGDGFLLQDDELEDGVKNCNYQTLRLRQDIHELKRKFRIELERTEDLIKATVNLERDLSETLFLDKMLRLLNGHTDNVSFSNCPFKIISDSSTSNLIV